MNSSRVIDLIEYQILYMLWISDGLLKVFIVTVVVPTIKVNRYPLMLEA